MIQTRAKLRVEIEEKKALVAGLREELRTKDFKTYFTYELTLAMMNYNEGIIHGLELAVIMATTEEMTMNFLEGSDTYNEIVEEMKKGQTNP